MNSNNPAPWNKIQTVAPECPPPTRAPRKHSLRGWFQGGGCRAKHDGGWGTITTPALRATPPQRGILPREGTYQVPLHWRGAPTPGPAQYIARVQFDGNRYTLSRSKMPTAHRAGGGVQSTTGGGVQLRPRHYVPPLRRGEFCPATVRTKFPSIGGVARSAGVVREFKNTHLVP